MEEQKKAGFNLLQEIYATVQELKAATVVHSMKSLDESMPLCSKESDKLSEALAAAQGEYKAVITTGKSNRGTYATLNDYKIATGDALKKYSLSITQAPVAMDNGFTYLYTKLKHASGQFEAARVLLEPEQQKVMNDLQSFGSAQSYMQRYSYRSLVGITEPTDTDNDGFNYRK